MKKAGSGVRRKNYGSGESYARTTGQLLTTCSGKLKLFASMSKGDANPNGGAGGLFF